MFLVNLRRHLAEDGIAFLSTPNRRIFSLDHVPSPMNQEHVRELAYEELIALLNPHFSRVEVYGQRFVDRELLEAWKEDVRRKDRAVQAGDSVGSEGYSAQSFARFRLIYRRLMRTPCWERLSGSGSAGVWSRVVSVRIRTGSNALYIQ